MIVIAAGVLLTIQKKMRLALLQANGFENYISKENEVLPQLDILYTPAGLPALVQRRSSSSGAGSIGAGSQYLTPCLDDQQ
jgi:hypothetical protein